MTAFTARRSHHQWAHQMPNACPAPTLRPDGKYDLHWDHVKPIPRCQLESMERLRFHTGEGGPGDYRPDYILDGG